jgi:sugar-specific transcriptional regulator TrmB
MDLEIELQELGLSKPEIRAYKSLLVLGEAKTGNLCSHAKIHSSQIYSLLESLTTKGLVTFSTKNNIKIFSATPVTALQTIFEEKKQALNAKETKVLELIKNLSKLKPNTDSASKYKYFEKTAGIKSLLLEVLDHMEKAPKDKKVHIHSANKEVTTRLTGFFDFFSTERVKKGVSYELIASSDMKELQIKRNKELTQVRFKNITTQISWGVYNEYFFIINSGTKEPYGILIKDLLTASAFEMVFAEIWEMIK